LIQRGGIKEIALTCKFIGGGCVLETIRLLRMHTHVIGIAEQRILLGNGAKA